MENWILIFFLFHGDVLASSTISILNGLNSNTNWQGHQLFSRDIYNLQTIAPEKFCEIVLRILFRYFLCASEMWPWKKIRQNKIEITFFIPTAHPCSHLCLILLNLYPTFCSLREEKIEKREELVSSAYS